MPARTGTGRYKDTKRWCRGKVGREHVWVVKPAWPNLGNRFVEDVCQGCGKKMRFRETPESGWDSRAAAAIGRARRRLENSEVAATGATD